VTAAVSAAGGTAERNAALAIINPIRRWTDAGEG